MPNNSVDDPLIDIQVAAAAPGWVWTSIPLSTIRDALAPSGLVIQNGHRSIDASVVEEFLATLTETEAGTDDWPEYRVLLDALYGEKHVE